MIDHAVALQGEPHLDGLSYQNEDETSPGSSSDKMKDCFVKIWRLSDEEISLVTETINSINNIKCTPPSNSVRSTDTRQQQKPTRVHHLTVSSIKSPAPEPLPRTIDVFRGFTTADTVKIPYSTIEPDRVGIKIQTLTRLEAGEYEISDGVSPPEKIKVSSPDMEMTTATAIDAIVKAFINDGGGGGNSEKPQPAPQVFRADEKTLERFGITSLKQIAGKESGQKFVKMSTLQNVLGIKTLPSPSSNDDTPSRWSEIEAPAEITSPIREEVITATDTEEEEVPAKPSRKGRGRKKEESSGPKSTTQKSPKRGRKRKSARWTVTKRRRKSSKSSPSKRNDQKTQSPPPRGKRDTETPTRDERPRSPIDYQSPLDALYDKSPTRKKTPYDCFSSNLVKIAREETVETTAAIREQEMSKLLKIRSLNKMLNERVPGAGREGTKVLVEYLRNAYNNECAKNNVMQTISKNGTFAQKKRIQFQVNQRNLLTIPEGVPETSKKVLTEQIRVNGSNENIEDQPSPEAPSPELLQNNVNKAAETVSRKENTRLKAVEKIKQSSKPVDDDALPTHNTKRGLRKELFKMKLKIKSDEDEEKPQRGRKKKVQEEVVEEKPETILPPIDDDIQQILDGVRHQTADANPGDTADANSTDGADNDIDSMDVDHTEAVEEASEEMEDMPLLPKVDSEAMYAMWNKLEPQVVMATEWPEDLKPKYKKKDPEQKKPGSIYCDLCKKFFTCQSAYDIHSRSHIVERPYVCYLCDKAFPLERYMQSHIDIVHKKCVGRHCPECKKKLSSLSALRKHFLIHTGEKDFECELCKKRFVQGSQLDRHRRTHYGIKPFKCNICNFEFSQKIHLINHLRTHSDEKPFQCNTCGKMFRRQDNLDAHTRVHTGIKPFNCHLCPKGFTVKNLLLRHMVEHNIPYNGPGRKKRFYKCKYCPRVFNYSRSIIDHHRVHTGEKPYECYTCGKRFVQKGGLICHLLTHTGEKPYPCIVCGHRFAQKGYLSSHMRTHTGEQPFACPVCDRKFSQKCAVNAHMKLHREKHGKLPPLNNEDVKKEK